MELVAAGPGSQDRADSAPSGTGDGAKTAAELAPRHLSPSGASVFRQCPRRWRFRYVERLPDPPGEAALAGTFAHRVLELLLQMPAAERTVDTARALARRAWPEIETDEDFRDLGLDEEAAKAFRWRGWLAVEGLWRLEDPCTVEVHATEHDVAVAIDGVPFRGIIDRVDTTEAGLVVSDYKSGQAPGDRWSAERLDQVLLYAAALAELTGQRPVKARLLYLGQKIVDVDVDDDSLGGAVSALRGTWDALTAAAAADEFEAKPGPLCGWCPYVGRCAEGAAEVRFRDDAGRMRADAPALVTLAEAG
ncbi:MAG: PD-(D/E)XK nuclease family protein [Acidimicrobiales bacterium]